jgi:hypothetical protein
MKRFRAVLPMLLVLTLSALSIQAPLAWAQQPQRVYSHEELAQLLAPIALFPDPLLAQILMASTYPLEVVEADRWMKQHPGLQDGPLDTALQDLPWDPSVKSLCHYPTVLTQMDNNLTNTTNLGNAFLAQQDEVMDTVQDLRQRAQAQGSLQSTPQQQIVVRERVVYVEPANPAVVYVPVYNPAVVYGPWLYPAYPPYYWYPGQASISFGISFGTGFFVGAAVNSWSYFDWPHRIVVIDPHRTVVFNRHVDVHRAPGWGHWEHDPHHRRGVAYRDNFSAQRFGQGTSPGPEGRRENRGFNPRWQGGPGQQAPGHAAGTRQFTQTVPPAPGVRPQGQRPGQAVPPSGQVQGQTRGSMQGQPGHRQPVQGLPAGQTGSVVQRPSGVPTRPERGGRPGQATPPAGLGQVVAPAPTHAAPAQGQAPSLGGTPQRATRENAFTGVNRGGGEFERSASQRGSASRTTLPGASPAPGPSSVKGQGNAPSRGGPAHGGQSQGPGSQGHGPGFRR